MTFYWQHARDSLLTTRALQIYQIAYRHDGEDFDAAKVAIDDEYRALVGGDEQQRHGGDFQTYVQVFREAGWIDTSDGRMRVTPVGRQAFELLANLPDFLKAVPYFLVDLLARYQLNNPARPADVRNEEIAAQIRGSNIFPYWTIWKVMRACENYITIDELRRFVFTLQRRDDMDSTIDAIHRYRLDRGAGLDEDEITRRYPAPLEGAVGEPKYIMARAGIHIGRQPALIFKPTPDRYQLHDAYLPFIDSVIADEPVFAEHLSADTWMADYGRPVGLAADLLPAAAPQPDEGGEEPVADEDVVWHQIKMLIEEDGALSFLLSGPPGTSKSWYARRLAAKMADRDTSRIHYVQFHPSFAYEDFVQGYVPSLGGDSDPRDEPDSARGAEDGATLGGAGQIRFRLRDKILLKAADQARDGSAVVLVIDELTRGDVGRIFGEALTYIEPGYRDQEFTLASGTRSSLPRTLFIVATANPYDRSVTDIDVALQRRFEIISMDPSASILRSLLHGNGMEDGLIDRVMSFFASCQTRLPFGGLGHTYFLHARDRPSLKRVWMYRLEPMLKPVLRFEPQVFTELRTEYFDQVLAE